MLTFDQALPRGS